MPYVISYLRNRTDDVNIRNVDGMWMASGSAVSAFAGMTVGGIVDKQFGPRTATGIGVFIFRYNIMEYHNAICERTRQNIARER